MEVGSSQKERMACNVHEKKTRGRPASIVSGSPSATGMIWNNNLSAARTVVKTHKYESASVANIAKGDGAPGLSNLA